MTLDPLKLDYQPVLPPKRDYGIAILGCSGITTNAHLPIYRRHGLNIVGCFDARRAQAETFARWRKRERSVRKRFNEQLETYVQAG